MTDLKHAPASRVRYEMTEHEERERVLLAQRVGEQLDDDHWLIVGGPRSLAGQLGRVVERRVFMDAGYEGCDASDMQAEYAPYEARSIFVVIVGRSSALACGRSIWSAGPLEPLKLEDDLDLDPHHVREALCLEPQPGAPAPLWEMATIVVAPEERNSELVGHLLGELRYQEMLHAGPNCPSVAMICDRFFRMLQLWGVRIEPLLGADPVDYYGSPAQPALVHAGPQWNVRGDGPFAAINDGYVSRAHRPLVDLEIDLRQPTASELAVAV